MAFTTDDVRRALQERPGQPSAALVSSRAAVAVILRPSEAGLDVLLIRRAEHPRDPWSGQMAFPGGRAEPRDAGLSATAAREVAEEIGLDLVRDGELLGPLDEVRALARMRPMDLTIQPFVFSLHGPGEAEAREEVSSVHWLSLEHLLDGTALSIHKRRYGNQTEHFPCLRTQGLVIWGLTYRMLVDLGERLKASAKS